MKTALLGSSWKTSLTGYIAAAAVAFGDYLMSGKPITWREVTAAVIIAVAGRIVKDYNVTGGSKQ